MKRYIQQIKNFYHLFQAVLANILYGFPSRKIKVIGITGTDGKTTTTHLIHHILESSGYKVSLISSVYAKIAGKISDTGFHVTTPDSFFIQKAIRQAVDHGDEYFVLETTSHSLDQNRVWGINYEIGVLTNVTHEHLDYHQSYQEYLNTKLKLLKKAKVVIVNEDDESYKYIAQSLKLKAQSASWQTIVKTYGLRHSGEERSDDSRIKQRFWASQNDKITEYNQYNYSAGYAVCYQLGLSDEKILSAMQSFTLPTGRLETVYDKDFKVIIDFAHTPNAIEKVLESVRKLYLSSGGRLIHVFGSAGLRDVTKRPLMGEASGKFADIVILTEEDYRVEDVNQICYSIALGLEKNGFRKLNFDVLIHRSLKTYSIIVDRQEAINKAISLAKKGDLVILTGKGHEKSLCRGKKEWPWDEREAVKLALSLKLKT